VELYDLFEILALASVSGGIGAIAFAISATPSHRITIPFCNGNNGESKLIEIGCFGDTIIGIAASLGALFFASSLFNINVINIADSEDYVRLVSISVVSGYAGIRLLTTMSDRFTKELKNQEKRIEFQETEIQNLKREVKDKLDRNLREGLLSLAVEEIEEALKIFDAILAQDSKNIEARIGRAKALKRRNKQGDLEKALSLIEEILEDLKEEKEAKYVYYKARCFYNKACYQNLLEKYAEEQILSNLREAFKLFPQFKKFATTDPDLASLKIVLRDLVKE
jgi:tetratricopeptide (TPR) repeat protein